MRSIKIIKNQIQTNGADFIDTVEADLWLQQGIQSNWWGKPERWVTPEQESVVGAEAQQEIDGVMHYRLPAEYEVQIIDAPNASADEKWEALRKERNKRLSACDWTQLVDAPLTLSQKQEWRDYRQALRDLPGTVPQLAEMELSDVVWPSEPEQE